MKYGLQFQKKEIALIAHHGMRYPRQPGATTLDCLADVVQTHQPPIFRSDFTPFSVQLACPVIRRFLQRIVSKHNLHLV